MAIPLDSRAKGTAKGTFSLKEHFLISVTILSLVMGAGWLSERFLRHDPKDVLRAAQESMDRGLEKAEYKKLIQADPRELKNHRGYLNAHFAVPKVRHTRHTTITRDDGPIEKEYLSYSRSADPVLRDIGFYGLGFIRLKSKDYSKALDYLGQVADRKMPYLNNTIGYSYQECLHQPAKAEPYFRDEIELKGNLEGAVDNLARLYLRGKNYQELGDLVRDRELGKYVSDPCRRYLALGTGDVPGYFFALFRSESDNLSWESLATSLLIALMFLVYVYFVDAFEKETISLMTGIFALGLLSAVICTLFYDTAGFYLNFHRTGEDLHDLFYFVLGVGLIEETSKILPVLAAVLVLKKWNEPVDILIFAAVSALGFACLENASYFHQVALGLIVGRTLSAVVMHVCLTTLAVYGVFYWRQKKAANGPFYAAGFFLAAVLAHGLYDFFISSSLGLGIFSTVILIYMMVAFHNMMENGLGQSPFMTAPTWTVNLTTYLFYGLFSILCLQFLVLAVQFDFTVGLKNMGLNILQFYILALFLMTNLGRLNVVRNKWVPVLDRSAWTRKKR